MKLSCKRNMKKSVLTVICMSLVFCMLFTGCGAIQNATSNSNPDKKYAVKLNQTIMPDSKWINSSIPGAIDSNTQIRLQDDFYTYVNKDWIVENYDCLDEYSMYGPVIQMKDIVLERKFDILSGKLKDAPVNSDFSKEDAQRDYDIVSRFAEEVLDSESRNADRYEPIRSTIESIMSIDSMEDLNDFVLNRNGDNISCISFVYLNAETTLKNTETYSLFLTADAPLSLMNKDEYANIKSSGMIFNRRNHAVANEVLGEFGYSEKEISEMIVNCYKLESYLAPHVCEQKEKEKLAYYAKNDNYFTLDDLTYMLGDYPIKDFLSKYDCDKLDNYYLPSKNYIVEVGKVYKQKNIEKIKAYLIINTIVESSAFLGDSIREVEDNVVPGYLYEGYFKEGGNKKSDKNQNITENEAEDEKGNVLEGDNTQDMEYLFDNFINKYLPGPMENLYVYYYVKGEEKAYLKRMVYDLLENYESIIHEQEWMEDITKQKAVEKLKNIKVNVLYPDMLEDYGDIQFEDGDTLPVMMGKIKESNIRHMAKRAGQPANDGYWSLTDYPTTEVNAQYMPTKNGIYIFAGYISSKEIFDVDAPYEKNLGAIGNLIGHEISHGFDNVGANFDQYGYMNNWWTNADKITFINRTSALELSYSAIRPGPGFNAMNGFTVAGEAIADMAGLKSTLMLAKRIDGFDYDMFFKSFANSYKAVYDYATAQAINNQDPHPLNFMRVNMPLIQVDEFRDYYGIKEGDGMYLPSDKRINVW